MVFEIVYKISNKVTEVSVIVHKEEGYGFMSGLELRVLCPSPQSKWLWGPVQHLTSG